MVRYVLKPIGCKCTLDVCRPGLFMFMVDGKMVVGIKSQYGVCEAHNEYGESIYLPTDGKVWSAEMITEEV